MKNKGGVMKRKKRLARVETLIEVLSDIELLSSVALDVNESSRIVLLKEVAALSSKCVWDLESHFKCPTVLQQFQDNDVLLDIPF